MSTDNSSRPSDAEHGRAVYAISIAAEMVSMNIQNLRVYERHGVVTPRRTAGGNRLYSRADLARLVRVRDLLGEGLNMAGIVLVMRLQDEVDRLAAQVHRLQQDDGTEE